MITVQASVHPDIRRIRDQLCGGSKVLFFIGAGLSRPLGLPLWHELLEDLIEYGRSIGRLGDPAQTSAKRQLELSDYLGCGEILRKHLGSRVDERLYEVFSRALPNNLGTYELLVRIPAAGYITTNYDLTLETAYAKVHGRPPPQAIADEPTTLGVLSEPAPFILKLHGDVRLRKFVFAESDYDQLRQNNALSRRLYSLFSSHTVVFLGYGVSDDDIRAPLQLIQQDFAGRARRHVAILPRPQKQEVRHRLEDELATNVVEYDPENNHRFVQETVVELWAGTANPAGPVRVIDEFGFAQLSALRPKFLEHQIRLAAHRAADWVLAQSEPWGRYPGDAPAGANIAESLIAADAAKRVLRKKPQEIDNWLTALLGFQNGSGGFVSKTFGSPTVHTTSLATYALVQYQARGPEIGVAIERAVNWLIHSRAADSTGWGSFAGSKSTRVIPSIWACAALASCDELPRQQWIEFRNALQTSARVSHRLSTAEGSAAAAGWLLWYLGALWASGQRDYQNVSLAQSALEQLGSHDVNFASESEAYEIDDVGPPDKVGMWVSWIHPSASAAVLGSLRWTDQLNGMSEILGRALWRIADNSLSVTASKIVSTERTASGAPYAFHNMYATWALCEYIQQSYGVLIDKVGMIVLKDRRVLLVRKRGTTQLILPGGSIEPGEEPDIALRREMREELGVVIGDLRSWATFSDVAAFEPGAIVQIRAYIGSIVGDPTPEAEIAELAWADSTTPADQLSPIIRNQIVPALARAGFIS